MELKTYIVHKIQIIFRSVKLSYSIKSRFSKIIFYISFIAGGLPIAIAKLLEKLSDELYLIYEKNGKMEQIYTYLLYLVTLFGLQLIYTCFHEFSIDQDRIIAAYSIRKRILECKCKIDYKYIENYDKFIEKIGFVKDIAGFQTIGSLTILSSLGGNIVILVSILVTFYKSKIYILLIVVFSNIPIGILIYLQNKESYMQQVKSIEERAFINYYRNTCIDETKFQEIRQYNLHDFFQKKWYRSSLEFKKIKKKLTYKYTLTHFIEDLLRNIVLGSVLIATLIEIRSNSNIGFGHFVLVFTLTRQLQDTISILVNGVANFMGTIPYMEQFFYFDDLLQTQNGERTNVTSCLGDIKVENLYFNYYNSTKEVLKNINVKIRDGEKIAIIGENGSGKSTFINLLCGLLQPKQGNIYIGGEKVKEGYGSNIAAVFQDFACYSGSIRYNIALSDSGVDDEKILRILKMLNWENEDNSNILDQQIGLFSDTKDDLSGGQWQKIALARTIYNENAKILIFDEPTSAMDPISEAELYNNFMKLTGDKTTLIISHRLGIGKIVDRILVFKNGEIVENGMHEELLKKNSEYARMFRTQKEWYC